MKNRRIISAITAGLICLSFAACSNSGNAPAAETSKKTEQTTTTAADKNESETSWLLYQPLLPLRSHICFRRHRLQNTDFLI